MGYSYRNHGQIKDFWPDNDEKTFYLQSGFGTRTLEVIFNDAKTHFARFGIEVQMSDLEITAEKIHTYCLTYDRYDPGDWTDFLVIRKIEVDPK